MSRQNWWQLSSIQIGGAVCLPVIMVGHTLNQSYGFTSAVAAVLIGNFILLALQHLPIESIDLHTQKLFASLKKHWEPSRPGRRRTSS